MSPATASVVGDMLFDTVVQPMILSCFARRHASVEFLACNFARIS